MNTKINDDLRSLLTPSIKKKKQPPSAPREPATTPLEPRRGLLPEQVEKDQPVLKKESNKAPEKPAQEAMPDMSQGESPAKSRRRRNKKREQVELDQPAPSHDDSSEPLESPTPVATQLPPPPVSQGPAAPPDEILVGLKDLLEHHLRHYSFAPEDAVHVSALLTALFSSDLLKSDFAHWVVLHKTGPSFAVVTSSIELKYVSNPGDTALLLVVLRQLLKTPISFGLLKEIRSMAPDLFESCSHLIALQVLTPPVLERCIEEGAAPITIARQVGEIVEDIYLKHNRPLSPLLRQARIIEILASTWALGYDGARTLELAPLTCERVARSDLT